MDNTRNIILTLLYICSTYSVIIETFPFWNLNVNLLIACACMRANALCKSNVTLLLSMWIEWHFDNNFYWILTAGIVWTFPLYFLHMVQRVLFCILWKYKSNNRITKVCVVKYKFKLIVLVLTFSFYFTESLRIMCLTFNIVNAVGCD